MQLHARTLLTTRTRKGSLMPRAWAGSAGQEMWEKATLSPGDVWWGGVGMWGGGGGGGGKVGRGCLLAWLVVEEGGGGGVMEEAETRVVCFALRAAAVAV